MLLGRHASIAGSSRELEDTTANVSNINILGLSLSCLVWPIFLYFLYEIVTDGDCKFLQILTRQEEPANEDGIADLCDI